MTAKGFFIGVLVGGIVGAGIALLFAPMEGTATRQKITDASKSARDRATQVASNVRGRAGAVKEAVRPSM